MITGPGRCPQGRKTEDDTTVSRTKKRR